MNESGTGNSFAWDPMGGWRSLCAPGTAAPFVSVEGVGAGERRRSFAEAEAATPGFAGTPGQRQRGTSSSLRTQPV